MTAQILLVKGNQKMQLFKQNKSSWGQTTLLNNSFSNVKYTMQIK